MNTQPIQTAHILCVGTELLLGDLRRRLGELRLRVEVTDAAKDTIIESGFDPIYGARPLKRYIQSRVETLAAKYIIERDPEPDSVIVIDADENGLKVR